MKEQELIKKYRTTEHDLGFNLTSGGEHCEFSELTKLKKSKQFDVEQVKQWYLVEGKTQEEISKLLNCNISALGKFLKHNNIAKPKQKQITKEDLLKFNSEGKTLKQIAEILGYSEGTILRYYQQFGIKKTNHRNKKIINEELLAMYQVFCVEGCSHKEALQRCTTEYKCTLRTIQYHFSKLKK